MRRKAKKFAVGIGVFLFWMAVWEVASLIIAKSVILPSPPAVLRALFVLYRLRALRRADIRRSCGGNGDWRYTCRTFQGATPFRNGCFACG